MVIKRREIRGLFCLVIVWSVIQVGFGAMPAGAAEQAFPIKEFNILQPTLRCPFLAMPPVIDGKLDEVVWLEAQRIPSLWTYGEDDSGVPPTTVALGWDKENLYVGFICGLPTAEEKPSAPPVKSDAVEIVLDGRKAGGDLLRIEVDRAGKAVRSVWADGKEWREAPAPAAGEKDIGTATGTRLGFRMVELGVPFSVLKLKELREGASLGLRLRRKQERDLQGVSDMAGKVWASRKTWHAWPSDAAFQEPGKNDGGLLVLTRNPVAYFPFPEANLDADGFWWPWYRAYATGNFQGKVGMVIEKDGRIERQMLGTVNYAKGQERTGYFADSEIATNNKFPCVGSYTIAFVTTDNAGNILYQTPPVSAYGGRLRLAGLLPAYYNDEEAIHLSVCFTGPVDEIDRMASQQQKAKEPLYYVRMTMRAMAFEGKAGVEKDTYFFRERYICLFRRSTNFGSTGLSSVWDLRGLPPGRYGFKVQLIKNSDFDVASWQQNSWKRGMGLNIVEELPEQEFHILRPPEEKQPEEVKSVTVGPEGGILVNSKPFMPLGVYHALNDEYRFLPPGLYRARDQYHGTIRRLGFNFIEGTREATPEDVVRQLDLAWKSGLYAGMITESTNWPGVFTDQEREGGLAKVRAAAGHPALLFIFQPDELLGYGGDHTHPAVTPAKKYYAAVREIAPQYLVFADTTSYPAMFPERGRDILETYAGFVDAIGIDSYNVGGCSNMRNYYDSARLVNSVVRPLGKTQVFVPQANVVAPIQYMPSPVEMRAQALLTIMGGSKGVAWYTYASHGVYQENGLLEYPQGWAYMKKLNRDLLELTDAVAGKRSEDVIVFPSEGTLGVRMTTPNKEYVFVANLDRAPKSLAVERPQMQAGMPVAVHGECRTIKSEVGGWADRFEPYGIHVYVLDTGRE
ncbi:MAG: hypothetical protein HY318_13925 [Armatimonadetes bacterium]|nr:hypothetical protein [Armatimonadota bacterium]